jgi:flagellar protein FlaF
MSNAAAQAYARVSTTTAAPREIEAQALLKAANQLQDAVTNADPFSDRTQAALLFNRKLWSIFVGDAMNEQNPEKVETREQIANIGIFVMTQCTALQQIRQVEHLQTLIDINRNIAAGLSGRP